MGAGGGPPHVFDGQFITSACDPGRVPLNCVRKEEPERERTRHEIENI